MFYFAYYPDAVMDCYQHYYGRGIYFFLVTHPLNPPPVRGIVFYCADYPDAVIECYRYNYGRDIYFFLLPTP